ncbi:DUF4136 domain-containing protein [Psychroflexus aestuariivivens]|uniref:DUF4136 domain-containing protein n=1 Tax=Psychroflexus aestuariivivens TaxID=1795040 RepID=UPI000FD90AA0|nr:DUF4136 domain-containing protein [Psychroflexus aestuariivivens]
MKYFFSLLILSIFLSCNTPMVFVDYNESANFEKYDSFDFYAIENSGLSRLDEDRVYNSIKDSLQAKGFKQKLIPKFKVNFYAEVFEEASGNNVNIGIGTFGGGIGVSAPQSGKRKIALTIEFADGLTNDLFWQAVVEASFDENLKGKAREEFFNNLVSEALEEYPPELEN